MDIQLKRGLLEVCILKVLSLHDSYGYQIIKDLSELVDISESTLYPILKRLETAACLTVYSVEHNSRLRKYYKITPQGQEKIDQFLEEWHEVMTIYQYIKGENIYDKN
ncbi:MAG: PadR family transcriptional regulator [Oscillospiraceae bacterium]|nr:PadR family transcriptional regulator [Oscillospiraceae bacterium]